MRTLPLLVAAVTVLLAGCRGGISREPPIHVVPDMDFQPKILPQSEFDFPTWTDKRGDRLPVPGTVAKDSLRNPELSVFKRGDAFVDNPLPPTRDVFARGRQRFDIYCAVCHDRAGTGNGLVMKRAPVGAFAVPPNLATEPRLRAPQMRDGEIFQTISEGKSTMPAYGHMIPREDRWAIVHYVRALQNRIQE
jgi:mono/diheme cytochrome c family protein